MYVSCGTSLFKNISILNTDLLFSGIILHDLGKVFEINDYINTDKTFNGELLGHINIVNDLITETIIDENQHIYQMKMIN